MTGHAPAGSIIWMRTLVIAVVLCGCVCIAQAAEGDAVTVNDLRYWSYEEGTRFVVDLTGAVAFSKDRLTQPDRVFVDLAHAKLAKGAKTQIALPDGPVRVIRLGQFNAQTVRIVFDIGPDSPASFDDIRVTQLEDPPRLVIDFVSKTQPRGNESPVEPGAVRKRIVIDPGHGGEDPGAVGYRGLYEKDVVLDIALKVRDLLKTQFPHYDVLLTRDRDVFIPLQDRTAYANRHKADLFVSIHANASPRRQARGIETYLLNYTDDAEAMRVAARENAISLKRMRQVQDEVGVILASLERENKRDESARLARNLQNQMISAVNADHPAIPDLGVKQALFFVLIDARMPSALVEVSFMSNAEEERLLSTPEYRKKIASSIARGIHSYLSTPPVQKVVALKPVAKLSHRAQGGKYTFRQDSR